VDPALHVQSALDVLAMGEVEAAGHVTHETLDVFPTPDRYPFNSDEGETNTSFDRCLFQT
jgi:hypothetical protein